MVDDDRQREIEARGVGSFAPFSSNPANLSDNDSSYSYGGGLRLGYLGNLSPYFSIGASYQTKIWMSEFDEYSGLFAEQGDFDIPSKRMPSPRPLPRLASRCSASCRSAPPRDAASPPG